MLEQLKLSNVMLSLLCSVTLMCFRNYTCWDCCLTVK